MAPSSAILRPCVAAAASRISAASNFLRNSNKMTAYCGSVVRSSSIVRSFSSHSVVGKDLNTFRKGNVSGIGNGANATTYQAQRHLHLQEYQSKSLLKQSGLNVQRGDVANSVEEAYKVAKELKASGAEELVLKCQVLAGGRGKGKLTSGLEGGVKLCKTAEEVRDFAEKMIGFRLITHQTNSDGEMVKQVLILESVDLKKELYVAIVMDRKFNGPTIIYSQMGGMNIEDVAKNNPDAVQAFPINVFEGITPTLAKTVCNALGFTTPLSVSKISEQIFNLYSLFNKYDVTQLEINPLAVIEGKGDDEVIFIDAKIEFDDNAAFRQKELFAMEDKDRLDQREVCAEEAELNFVSMDGNIGCLVNGAGLAMATMDIIKLYGGEPANFLDVGGNSSVSQIAEGLKLIQEDPKVKALFVNTFGGIMRCDYVAKAIIDAAKTISMRVPFVVRLCGNNVDAGREILQNSGLKLEVIDDFDAAAQAVCRMVSA